MTTTNEVGPSQTGRVDHSIAAVSTEVAPAGLDTTMTVMAIRSATRRDRMENGAADARAAEVDRQAEVRARLEAMRKATEARDDGGFWSDVADIAKKVALVAAVVVGAAATIYTAGTSGLLAAAAVAALTAAPAVLPELATQIAEATNASTELSLVIQGVALAACIALAIWNPAGAISGVSQAASNVTTTTARTVAQVAHAMDGMGRIVQAQAQVYQGIAAVGEGINTIQAGGFTAEATRHQARSTTAGRERDEAMDHLETLYREAVRDARAFARMLDNQESGRQAALRA
jgi:hypothetical protein